MSDEQIRSLRQKKQAIDNDLNAAFSKEMNDFIAQSNETLRKMRESNRQYWVQQAQKELALAEADAKKGDRVSAMSHSLSADTYLSLAEMA